MKSPALSVASPAANSLAAWNVDSGIQVNASARKITLTGNKIGDAATPSQLTGVTIFGGADQFAVTGNVAFHNSFGIINAAGNAATRVVTGNAQ